MREISDTITIDAPVKRMWALTVDIEGLPAVTPTVTAVERLDGGPLRPGSQARVRQPGLPPRVWTVEEVVEPCRFVWATTLLGVRMVGVHELEALEDGRTEQTLRVQMDGRGAKLMATLGRKSLAKTLATENAGFAKAASGAADPAEA